MAEDSTSKEETEQFIFKESEQRFQLADNVPTETTELMKQIGYLANSKIAEQILNGTFITPSDLDDATALVLEDIGRIGMQVRHGETIAGYQRTSSVIFGRGCSITRSQNEPYSHAPKVVT